jgi:hypothetical protein
MRRREFVTFLGGVASWPFAARAQGERTQRIGALMAGSANDPEGQMPAIRESLGG